MCGPAATTENNTAIGDVQSGQPVKSNFFDLTVPAPGNPRQPIGLAETENFSAEVVYSTRPTITASDTIVQMQSLVSVYVKPLSG